VNPYISPIPSYVTTFLGQAGAWVASALVAKGVLTGTDTDFVVGAIVAVGTLAWRLYSSHVKTAKFNDAVAAPAGRAK
jgi:hypothetical protein